mmetsp:Transcript_5962/g.23137  ORF Transcript_5962/g.23137 Transcript_5962/m.23137 type:complete len:245 (+) Transcript_5962:49-783(+)
MNMRATPSEGYCLSGSSALLLLCRRCRPRTRLQISSAGILKPSTKSTKARQRAVSPSNRMACRGSCGARVRCTLEVGGGDLVPLPSLSASNSSASCCVTPLRFSVIARWITSGSTEESSLCAREWVRTYCIWPTETRCSCASLGCVEFRPARNASNAPSALSASSPFHSCPVIHRYASLSRPLNVSRNSVTALSLIPSSSCLNAALDFATFMAAQTAAQEVKPQATAMLKRFSRKSCAHLGCML